MQSNRRRETERLNLPWHRKRARPLVALIVLGIATGCEGLLEVADNPDTASGDAAEGPGAYNARLIGSQSDFAVAFGDAVDWGGLFTDELIWGGPTQDRNDADRRDVPSDNIFVGNELWTPLQIAAKSAKDLAEDIAAGNFPDQVPEASESEPFARISLLAGYTRTLLADLFCTTAFDATGPELMADETYARAEAFFTAAIEASQASSATREAALVGRARVRLQMGDLDGALGDATSVSEEFEFLVEYSGASNREENQLFNSTWGSRLFSVASDFRDLTIDDTDTPDPRVGVFDTGGLSFNGGVRQFNPLKYNTRSAPIRLASWFEAQYIVAEVVGGAQARDIINDVRSRLGIDHSFDPSGTATETEILEKLLDERARTTFLEGQRMPDLRRFRERHGIDRYPTGADSGDQVCMPLPDIERANNPEI